MTPVKDKGIDAPPGRDQDALEPLPVRVFVHRQDGRWSAIAIDYTIVGQGETHDEALERLGELLCSYLVSCVRDGKSIRDAERPIGWRWSLELRLEHLVDRLRRAMHRASRGAQAEKVNLPVGGFDGCQPA